jgi:hypothetical protein
MGQNATVEWMLARFPSRGLREAFLLQVELWNRVEGLPTIEAQAQSDGYAVRLHSDDPRQAGIRRLIDSYGGYVKPAFLSRSNVAS